MHLLEATWRRVGGWLVTPIHTIFIFRCYLRRLQSIVRHYYTEVPLRTLIKWENARDRLIVSQVARGANELSCSRFYSSEPTPSVVYEYIIVVLRLRWTIAIRLPTFTPPLSPFANLIQEDCHSWSFFSIDGTKNIICALLKNCIQDYFLKL